MRGTSEDVAHGMSQETYDQSSKPGVQNTKPDAAILVQTSIEVESEYASSGATSNRSHQQERYASGQMTGHHTVIASAY